MRACVLGVQERVPTASEMDAMEALGVERRLLTDALRKAGGNKAQAADSLGLKSSTFRNKLAKYSLNGD